MADKVQELADEFNKLYWNAIHIEPETMLQAVLAGRRLILEMGREKIIIDSLLNQGNEK